MSIFDNLFGRQPTPPAQQPQQIPGNQPPPAPQNPPLNQNPTAPNQQAQMGAQAPAPEQSPLDQFQDIWKAKPATEGAPQTPTQAVAYDQAAVSGQLQKMDFMRSVNPADLQAIAAGGEGAVAALGNTINTVMRQALQMSTSFSAQSANTAAEYAYQQAQNKVPDLIRGQMTQNEFSAPEHNHPALQPMIQALTSQFQSQFPKASPQEVAAQVRSYLGTVGGVFAPKAAEAPGAQNAPKQQDWGNWFQQ